MNSRTPTTAPLTRWPEGEVMLEVPRKKYKLGEPVPITIIIKNNSNKTFDIQTDALYYILIYLQSPPDKWTLVYSHKESHPAGITTLRIGAYQSIVFNFTWSQVDNGGLPVQPGEYAISADAPFQTPIFLPGVISITIE
jgi:hypothetical protein